MTACGKAGRMIANGACPCFAEKFVQRPQGGNRLFRTGTAAPFVGSSDLRRLGRPMEG